MNEERQTSFRNVIKRRRSTRKFLPGREVGRDMLDRIVDCGRWVPSGSNSQCWDFIMVDDPQMREAFRQVFLHQAARLIDHARGLRAAGKEYLKDTVAIIIRAR